MPVPDAPKIYHIVHVDKLPSIVADQHLWSDAVIAGNPKAGTVVGMRTIKWRRLHNLSLDSHPQLMVGACVPFYFCPRSVMLYLLHMSNHPELTYRGGQEPIVHLESDLNDTVAWANKSGRRWAFTLSNAGSGFFEDRADLAQLNEVDWEAIAARQWSAPTIKEGKQAEFLVEERFPWHLIERIGVHSRPAYDAAVAALPADGHRPKVEIIRDWYY